MHKFCHVRYDPSFLMVYFAGATYPVSPQDQAALEANSETAKIIKANVATDPVGMRELEEGSSSSGKARRLFSADMFPLAATFKGVQLP